MPNWYLVMIYVEQSFLDKETCSEVKNFVIDNDLWQNDGNVEFWKNRVVSFSQLNKEVSKNIISKIRTYIKDKYNVDYVYCDTIDVVRWTPGLSQPVHIDACEGLEYRDFGSIIYLNDDFDGGLTHYPQKDIRVAPKAGTLVVHPGGKEYEHGVTTVETATRYTIASFWTTQMGKATYDCLH